MYDRETGRSRGFGFVTFTEKAHAEAACNQMNQAVSRKESIHVSVLRRVLRRIGICFARKRNTKGMLSQEIGGRTVNVNFAKQRAPREAGSFNRAPRSNY